METCAPKAPECRYIPAWYPQGAKRGMPGASPGKGDRAAVEEKSLAAGNCQWQGFLHASAFRAA
ncbi:hypothetical protein DWZ54_08035 [Mitsuokella sp. AF33-22]|nr:hypothetical protein DWZ54_08035 [Mitsuokella sp. AF33-22]